MEKELAIICKQGSDGMSQDDQYSGIALEMTLHGDPALKVYPHEKAICSPQLKAGFNDVIGS